MLKIISAYILMNEGKQVSLPVSFTVVEILSFLGRSHFFFNLQEDSVVVSCTCVFVYSMSEDGLGVHAITCLLKTSGIYCEPLGTQEYTTFHTFHS